MIKYFHSGFQHQIFRGKHRHIFGDFCVDRHFFIEDFFPLCGCLIFPHPAAPVHIDRFIQRDPVKMIHHKGRDLPERSHAAGTTVPFRKDHAHSLTRSHYRCTQTAGTAADHKYIYFRDHRYIQIFFIMQIHFYFSFQGVEVYYVPDQRFTTFCALPSSHA